MFNIYLTTITSVDGVSSLLFQNTNLYKVPPPLPQPIALFIYLFQSYCFNRITRFNDFWLAPSKQRKWQKCETTIIGLDSSVDTSTLTRKFKSCSCKFFFVHFKPSLYIEFNSLLMVIQQKFWSWNHNIELIKG